MTVDRIDVAFHGSGAGVKPLTWGQRAIYQAMRREQSWMPIGGRRAVAAGTTVASIAEELCFTVSRFQAFRTRLTFGADGHPRQDVADAGSVPLEVVEAAGRDPEQVAAEVESRYRDTEPDLTIDWPLRMAVVCAQGLPVQLVVIIPHLVTDAAGAAVMIDEVARRESAPPSGPQPLDLARWQQSSAGQRQNVAALRHWERHLADFDVAAFAGRAENPAGINANGDAGDRAGVGRYRNCSLTSPALAKAVPAIARRTDVDDAAILLTAYGLAFAEVTGATQIPVRQVVSNRFRPGLAQVVTPLTQLGLCTVQVGGGFRGTLDQVARAMLATNKHAYYDPDQLSAMLGRIGADSTGTVCLNDRRTRRGGTHPEPTGPIGESQFRWEAAPVGATEPLFVHLDDVHGAIRLSADVDTHHVPAGKAAEILRAMEAVTVAAAG